MTSSFCKDKTPIHSWCVRKWSTVNTWKDSKLLDEDSDSDIVFIFHFLYSFSCLLIFHCRNKSKLSSHPILCSISVLFCYHLGTVVKGSLIIPIMRVPRIILLSVYNILKNKVGSYFRFLTPQHSNWANKCRNVISK